MVFFPIVALDYNLFFCGSGWIFKYINGWDSEVASCHKDQW